MSLKFFLVGFVSGTLRPTFRKKTIFFFAKFCLAPNGPNLQVRSRVQVRKTWALCISVQTHRQTQLQKKKKGFLLFSSLEIICETDQKNNNLFGENIMEGRNTTCVKNKKIMRFPSHETSSLLAFHPWSYDIFFLTCIILFF